jgi:hypothetical protein
MVSEHWLLACRFRSGLRKEAETILESDEFETLTLKKLDD